MKDLPNSVIDRKNILNNNAALKELYNSLDFKGVLFEQKYRYGYGIPRRTPRAITGIYICR